ncbi:hypothetical protein L7F22_001910 [Adiantum nelumboides]|nr:hypothetical protein [Adiantum nelumboides]MCO5548453.1 hypothetical protein [Adiantum nelumboides]
MAEKKQHALAIPIPGLGHINPLMRFCKKLACEQGFTITFANIESIHNIIEEFNKQEAKPSRQEEKEEVGKGGGKVTQAERTKKLDIRRASLPFDFNIPDMANSDKQFEAFFGALYRLAPHIEELLEKLMNADPPVTCVISDILMTAPTQSAAQKFGIPRIAFQTHSLSVLLFTQYVLKGTVPLSRVLEVLSNMEKVKDDILATELSGLPTLKNRDILDFIDNNPFLYQVYIDTLRESQEKSLAIAVNTFEELERDALRVDFGVPIFAVGPLVDSLDKESSTSMWREDQQWTKWLDQQPDCSVLYISFGSLAPLSKLQYEEFVAGLVSSQQCFLWVFRPDLVKGLSYTEISSDINRKSNGKGYTVTWVPQTTVLAHPAIGGFLTHCGWNSTIEAISLGVPMLCFPYISDQFMDAAFIKEVWQVGLGFKASDETGVIERSEVERVVKLLMQQEGNFQRENARHYRNLSLKSLESRGVSLENIKLLAGLVKMQEK